MQSWLTEHSHFLIFAGACTAAFGAQCWGLRKVKGARLPWLIWILAAVLLAVTWQIAESAGTRERRNIQSITEGFARLYADAMEKRGHATVPNDVAPDDPRYLSLIETEKGWLAMNPAVNDIYTMRKTPDGKNRFIVDSETDYNRNGLYDEQREQRTPVGEVYDATTPGLEMAFRGQPNFDFVPVTDRWGTWVSAYVPLRDSDGRVEGVLGVDFDAQKLAAAIATAKLGVIGLMALVQLALLGSSSLTPVLHARIAERKEAEESLRRAHEDLEVRVIERTAELTIANSELQSEIAKRRKAQQALGEMNAQIGIVSHTAGMAEVANSVLHNVGNVLNSVNVSISLLAERLHASPLADLPNVAGLFRSHADDLPAFLTGDPVGRQVPDFISLLAGHWTTEHRELGREVERLQGSVRHIREIVGRQQDLGRTSGIFEEVHVTQLIDDALVIRGDALEKCRVTVNRDFADTPPVLCDRVKLMQILVNLIANAGESLSETLETDRLLTVRTVSGDGGSVQIHVIDNGQGIAPEVRDRLFTYGFTTKKDGHGFGLHSSALAAQDIGGTLRAESDGLDCGAAFIVELPPTRAAALPRAA